MSAKVLGVIPSLTYNVLKALEKNGELATMKLSENAHVSHSFLLKMVPWLREKGIVSVTYGKTDRRERLVKLTKKGVKVLATLEAYREALREYRLVVDE